ncbi:MAG: MATE family efflux transporter [Deltaproteobacteria bacterium]|nr:MATE family efflux transporter [Deltaproteobacteria bacterium]
MAHGTDRLDEFLRRPQRAVWVIALPMMAGMILQVLFNVVETAFVGRLGHEALAAMTVVFPLLFSMISLVNGIGSGVTVLVAQAIGRRDQEEAERVGGTSIALGLGLGLAIAALGALCGRPLIARLGGSTAVADLGWSLFLILVLTSPLLFVSAFLRFVLMGEGDTRTPLLVFVGITLVNVSLDPIFIFGLGLGIAGAAVAAAISQALMLLVFLYLMLWRRRNLVKLRARHLWPRWSTVRAVLTIGVPASLAQLTMSIGFMFLNRAVGSFGDQALAAFGVGARIDNIVGMPVLGLAAGSVAAIGMFAGAGRADLVRDVSWYTLRWATGIATVIGVLAFAASVPIMHVFTSDQPTIAIGRHYLRYMVFAYPAFAVAMVASRILLGIGYPNVSLAIIAVRLFVFAVPIAYVSVFLFGAPLDGIWAGLLSGTVVAAVASALCLRWLVWRRDPTVRAGRKLSLVETGTT